MNQETYPDRNLDSYFHLIHDKREKNIQWRKDSLFNKWCWENWTVSGKRIKSEQILTPCIKIKSKWIKYLNVRLGTIKTLEKKTGRTLSNINRREIFSKPLPRVMKIKTKINKCSLIKLKSWPLGDSVLPQWKEPTERKKISANEVTNRELIFKIWNSSCISTLKKKKKQTNIPIKK